MTRREKGNHTGGNGRTPAPAAGPSCITRAQARRIGRFALQLVGSKMAPALSDGALLVVDAHAKPKPGQAVIAEIAPRADGQYRAGCVCMAVNADGDLTDHAGGYVAAGRWRLVGVVTEVLATG